jgi:hypothetical protein
MNTHAEQQLTTWTREYRRVFQTAREDGKSYQQADEVAAERAYGVSGLVQPVVAAAEAPKEERVRYDMMGFVI